MTSYPLTNALLAAKPKPKPKPPKKPEVPLPGFPTRTGLDKPTIWGGKAMGLDIGRVMGRR